VSLWFKSLAGGILTKVLIIAGYASVRAGLHALLAAESTVEVLGAVEEVGDTLARLLSDLKPDALLLDTSGDGSTNSIARLVPLLPTPEETVPAPAVVLIGDDPDRDLPRLENADLPGWGYLLRESDGPQIIGAVRAAASGLVVLDRSLALPNVPERPALTRNPVDEYPGDALTPREIEVLQLMAEGLPNKIIASRLKISLHTAKFHVAQILGKLDATSRTEAVTIGARRGYVIL
jgi:two-component system, NarL family, response regulator YdfI